MIETLYPAARAFAGRLEGHFAGHARAATPPAAGDAPLPDAAAIEALIDAAFWASLQREEGFAPEISLASGRWFSPPLFRWARAGWRGWRRRSSGPASTWVSGAKPAN
jgi:hypothetical protein